MDDGGAESEDGVGGEPRAGGQRRSVRALRKRRR